MKLAAGALVIALAGVLAGPVVAAATGHSERQSHMRLSSSDVKQIQQKLDQMGYNPGPIDGTMGPRTRRALEQFQQAKSLPATGRPDDQTLAALDVHPHGGTEATSGTRRGSHEHESPGMRGESGPGRQPAEPR